MELHDDARVAGGLSGRKRKMLDDYAMALWQCGQVKAAFVFQVRPVTIIQMVFGCIRHLDASSLQLAPFALCKRISLTCLAVSFRLRSLTPPASPQSPGCGICYATLHRPTKRMLRSHISSHRDFSRYGAKILRSIPQGAVPRSLGRSLA